VGALNPATEALAAFTQGSDEDLNASPCVTSGCGFFGRRNWGGLCSECYKKQQVHQLPIQGHSALVQPTELADVASRRRHVVEYEYGLPKGERELKKKKKNEVKSKAEKATVLIVLLCVQTSTNIE
jgi:hypothetical protein